MKKIYRIEEEVWIIGYIPYEGIDLYKMATDNPNGCESIETLYEFENKEDALRELSKMHSEMDVCELYNQTRFTLRTLSCVEYDDDGEIYDITGENIIASFKEA